MGRRGPKPTPTNLRILRGNPSQKALPTDEVAPPPAEPSMATCPAWLKGSGRTLWKKLAPRALSLGLLTVVDIPKFEAFCVAYGRWREYERLCEKFGPAEAVMKGFRRAADNASGRMAQLGAAFGFDPSSRTGVKAVSKPLPADAGEALRSRFFGGNKA